MSFAPSGRQFELRLASRVADQTATIVEVGGGIRAYRVGDRDVLHPYPVDAMCDGTIDVMCDGTIDRNRFGRPRMGQAQECSA